MSRRDRYGIDAGKGIGEHRSRADTARITYERARSLGADRDTARKVADKVARDTHDRKE